LRGGKRRGPRIALLLAMASQQQSDELTDARALADQHRALKRQTAALQREHEQLHTHGGTRAEHQEHIRRLRNKINELELHVERLKHMRTSSR
jgi:seryl-tRNA synthetase